MNAGDSDHPRSLAGKGSQKANLTVGWDHLKTDYTMPDGRSILDEAREAVQTERQILRAERDAFKAFERRVESLTPTQNQVNQHRSPTPLLGVSPPVEGSSRIRVAYKETVMDVPHYDEEYGEPVLEHIRAELGNEYADVLRTATGLTPQLKQGILGAAATARERRATVLAVFDEETKMLDRAEAIVEEARTLNDLSIDCSFGCLCARYSHLRECERRAEALLTERQEHIQEFGQRHYSTDDVLLFNEHLYGSLSSTYPILSLITQQLEELRTARNTITQRITDWKPSNTN